MNSHYETIAAAIAYLSQHFRRQPTLEEVADAVHMSPFHFQRVFSQWVGISPKRFLQFLTAEYLKEKLAQSPNLSAAAESAGLSAQSRVYDLFVTLEAMTPQQYRSQGQGLAIGYGIHPTPFGECLIAATERGVCGLYFTEGRSAETCLETLRASWRNADFRPDPGTARLVSQIFDPSARDRRLSVLVKGTNFQVKVWEALLRLPLGSVTTYEGIAREIGNPGAVRAVGNAVGSNPVTYLIPCHRVIRKQGKIGGYYWGPVRKQAILAWEMARAEG